MSSNDGKQVMETTVSPVVSTNSDLSSPEEDKCILTPLSLEFDPLSWKLDEKSKSNNNSNTNSPENTAALIDDSILRNDLLTMTDSVQSFDLITMDDNFDTNLINEDLCEPNSQLIEEFEPTLSSELESKSWSKELDMKANHTNGDNDSESDVTINSSSVCYEPNDYEKRSTNECQIASVSLSNTLSDDSTNQNILMSEPFDQNEQKDQTDQTYRSESTVSAQLIAAKLVDECVSGALHENALLLHTNQLLDSSSSDSSLSEQISSDSDESVQSVSSASSGSSKRKKKNNTRKKASMATKPSVLPEQQITKTNSIEATKKSVENHVVDAKPEPNGHTTNDEEMNVVNVINAELPALNGYHKQINEINDIEPSLNGYTKHYEFDNDSLNENPLSSEPEYTVNVAKLCRTYIKSDDTHRNNNSKEVVITGISLKTLKNQYVSHVEHESQLLKSFPKEIANTGIDFKSLKNSYVSTAEHNVVTKNAINKELLPIGVNINSIKSTFNCEQEMSEEDKLDKTKAPKKFAQVNKDVESLCKVCAKHVYQMEKIKAEKCVFHKSCFRCKECNKQLNVDNYSSHEGELYCTPHFKQLFQPKAKFDTEDNNTQTKIDDLVYAVCDLQDDKGRQRKYEMIIRENTPQELPSDIVRSNSKVEDSFDSLQLDLINIRNRFESGTEFNPNSKQSNLDKSSLPRSESIHVRMQKYQCAASGEKDSSNISSDDEPNDDKKDNEPAKAPVVFSGLSSLKSQWESGSITTNKEEHEDYTNDELADLRKKLSLGRSESLKQVYERAVKESNSESGANRSDAIVLESSIKTNSIKEKFESGRLETETEEQRIERLKKEREEEIHLIAESETTAKEARNKFKQIDASATRGLNPTAQQNGSSNHSNGLTKKAINGDIVKSGGPIGDDITIDSAQLQERFSYFENLPKETPKEPKRFQITPPRETQHVVENKVEEVPNANLVRASDVIEEIPKVDTTKKMLDKFKALENHKENQLNGPKPLKRITPPREYTADESKPEPIIERDPNIIRSSLKSEDNIQVEPEKARNLKAKFENWSLEIDRENSKNAGYDEEEEYIPHIDTTKNLRAKFEAIKDERKPVDKPKVRVNRFVYETGDNSSSDLCCVCRTKLYPMEKLEFSGIRLHKNCFRCVKCKCNLRLDNFTTTAEKLYCIPHFKQLFMEKGNYDEGFGLEQHKDKWTNKSINVNNNNNNNNNNEFNNNNELICDVIENGSHFDYTHHVSDITDDY